MSSKVGSNRPGVRFVRLSPGAAAETADFFLNSRSLESRVGYFELSRETQFLGDILVARKQPAEAKAAYKLALDKGDKQDAPFRESVRMRLEALGG